MEYTKQALRFLGKYLNNATEGQERQLKKCVFRIPITSKMEFDS